MSEVYYKVSTWYVNSEGTASSPTTTYYSSEDRFKAEKKFHDYCGGACMSTNPLHVALLETIDGIQIKKECYRHETEETTTE